MAMAAEKCFALYFPLQAKGLCTVKTSKKISGIAAVALLGFNMHLVFIRDAKTNSNGKRLVFGFEFLKVTRQHIYKLMPSCIHLFPYQSCLQPIV